jgi:hypothetical protein
MNDNDKCINCGRGLVERNGARFCLQCNSPDLDLSEIFESSGSDEDYTFIECHGATLYKPGSAEIEAGVKFSDDRAGAEQTDEFEIVDRPVYAPTHKKRRRIKREALGRIRRCQGCQDFTIRMRRPEGQDFFIPSHKHPNRKTLKSMEAVGYEP